eukprot:gnl/TRDRNA2_/TRDRNA2_90082_c0_seq2.p1 gnl/TRDRNA2_/TRDRNA2_90082_c0~~gnl/TRDRNA2_/TRDRNA2_90082_c0_seq2.p1  ORF type:complete len:152 (-),score=8.49 gnl/TRDRNA2_/TRDRNA2_90082_c0_seq2:78-533(-)
MNQQEGRRECSGMKLERRSKSNIDNGLILFVSSEPPVVTTAEMDVWPLFITCGNSFRSMLSAGLAESGKLSGGIRHFPLHGAFQHIIAMVLQFGFLPFRVTICIGVAIVGLIWPTEPSGKVDVLSIFLRVRQKLLQQSILEFHFEHIPATV